MELHSPLYNIKTVRHGFSFLIVNARPPSSSKANNRNQAIKASNSLSLNPAARLASRLNGPRKGGALYCAASAA